MATAATAGEPAMFVRNVCGFFENDGFVACARSLRKKEVRSVRSPERTRAVAVGLGTVSSPRAKEMITFFAEFPDSGSLRIKRAQATGSPACCSQLAWSIVV